MTRQNNSHYSGWKLEAKNLIYEKIKFVIMGNFLHSFVCPKAMLVGSLVSLTRQSFCSLVFFFFFLISCTRIKKLACRLTLSVNISGQVKFSPIKILNPLDSCAKIDLLL